MFEIEVLRQRSTRGPGSITVDQELAFEDVSSGRATSELVQEVAKQLTAFDEQFDDYSKLVQFVAANRVRAAVKELRPSLLVAAIESVESTLDFYKTAFAALDEGRANESQLKSELSLIAESLQAQQKDELAEDLRAVASEYKVENEGRALDHSSVAAFRKFVRLAPQLRSPAVASTPNGYVYAAWRGPEGRLFSIQFLPSGFGRYVSFKPDPMHAGIRLRDFGTRPVDSLFELMLSHGVVQWASK